MRVLGIDPGSRVLGYGIVEERKGRLVHIGHGLVKTDPEAGLEHRLAHIFAELSAVVRAYRPSAAAVEGVFTFKNVRSALVLGQARGVALVVAAQHGLSVAEYSPAKVKRAVGAGGQGGKEAVARLVGTFLRLPPLERHDAYDALAVAICHCNHGRMTGVPTHAVKQRGLGALGDRLRPSYAPPKARVVADR